MRGNGKRLFQSRHRFCYTQQTPVEYNIPCTKRLTIRTIRTIRTNRKLSFTNRITRPFLPYAFPPPQIFKGSVSFGREKFAGGLVLSFPFTKGTWVSVSSSVHPRFYNFTPTNYSRLQRKANGRGSLAIRIDPWRVRYQYTRKISLQYIMEHFLFSK